MVKICTWGAFSDDGAPYVTMLPTTGRGFRLKFASGARKVASRETAELVQKFAEEYSPKPKHAYLLATALGAYEAWGANNNGDGFYEEDLLKESDDVGYRSFAKHGHVYVGHRNKDPKKAIGKVVLAAYNHRMRRVELIEELDMEKAASFLDQWEKTGSLPTSMGTKVPYDICASCGHKARRPVDYCEHAKYAMRRVLSNGMVMHVRNPNPRFFDQSHVIVPADKVAGVMEKVATVGYTGVVPSAVLAEELMGEKVASGDLWDLVKSATDAEPTLPLSLLEDLSEFPLEKVCSTMGHLGVIPNPVEWQYLSLASSGNRKLAASLYQRGVCFTPDQSLEVSTEGSDGLVGSWNIDRSVAMKLASFLPSRSCRFEFIGDRIVKEASAERVVPPWEVRAEEPGMGKTMVALAASYEIARRLLGNNEALLKGLKDATGMHPAVAAALVAAGAAGVLNVGERLLTPDPGTKISSYLSEISKEASVAGVWKETPEAVKSVLLPFTAGYTASAYYRSKQMQGKPTGSFQNLVADHPLISGMAAVAGAAKARQVYRRIKKP